MILTIALVVAAAGIAGVLVVALVGFLLARWLGRGAAGVFAAVFAIAIVVDLYVIAEIALDHSQDAYPELKTIFVAAYALPLLAAVPSLFYFGYKAFAKRDC